MLETREHNHNGGEHKRNDGELRDRFETKVFDKESALTVEIKYSTMG